MRTPTRLVNILALVSAPLLAGCIEPADDDGAFEQAAGGDGQGGDLGAGGAGASGGTLIGGGDSGGAAGSGAGGSGAGGSGAGGSGTGGSGTGGSGTGGSGTGGSGTGGSGTGGSGTGGSGSGAGTGGAGVGGTGGEGGESGGGGSGGSGGPIAPDYDACPGQVHLLSPYEILSIQASTAGLSDDHHEFCADTTPEADVGDAVFAFRLEQASTVVLRVEPGPGSELDPAIYVSDDCTTNTHCFDFGLAEEYRAHREAGTFYVVVDGAATEGAFELAVSATPPMCGDGVLNPAEDCDPGMGNGGVEDGCYDPLGPNECLFEPGALEKDTCPGEVFSVPAGTMMLAAEDGHTTIGYTDDYESNVCGYWFGLERVYRLVPEVDGVMTVTVGLDAEGVAYCAQDIFDPGCWDHVLYVRTDCEDSQTELGCSDEWWDTPETMTFPVTAGTPYFVFVDGYDDTEYSRGPYNLTIELN